MNILLLCASGQYPRSYFVCCSRTLRQMAALATGCTFMLLQTCAYAGLIDIKWAAIEKKIEDAVDGNEHV